jgi:integrase
MQVVEDPVEVWLRGLEKEKTRETYDRALRRLSLASGLTPLEMLLEARRDMKQFWVRIKADAMVLKPHVRSSAYSAVRNYLRAHGEFPPYDRIKRPHKARRSARITWDQALKICDAANPPYRYMFRMQLHCGWGIGEFFEWNRPENWKDAQHALEAYPRPEYYRFEFMERKSNDQPFHTLIPVQVLDDILSSAAVFPLTPKGGHPLDHAHYHNSKVVVDSAFRTALKRSGLTITGHLSPHDLRDVFRTEATIKGATTTPESSPSATK